MKDPLLDELLQKSINDTSIHILDFQKQSFLYQMECLKIEIDLVERNIARREAIAQNIKNFAVISWAAGITLFLSQADLRRFVIVTSILPIIFWLVDGWWIYLYMGSTVRLQKIREFLNSEDLVISFQRQKLVNFSILDISGKQYKGTKQYQEIRDFRRVLRFREMIFLYGGIALFSLIVGVVALIIF